VAHEVDPNWRVGGEREIAALLGVSDRTAHQWRYRGDLPPPDHLVNRGPTYRPLELWDRATVLDWARERPSLAERVVGSCGHPSPLPS
jgi:hypothetical protein